MLYALVYNNINTHSSVYKTVKVLDENQFQKFDIHDNYLYLLSQIYSTQ